MVLCTKAKQKPVVAMGRVCIDLFSHEESGLGEVAVKKVEDPMPVLRG
jgi:hypothetical protein